MEIVTLGGDAVDVLPDRHAGYCTLTKGDYPLLGIVLAKNGSRGFATALDRTNATRLRDRLTEMLGDG